MPNILRELRQEIAARIAARIRDRYGVEHVPVVELPPRRELGDLAFPAALHLAKTLKEKPRAIATELAAGLTMPEGVREVRIEGAGYLNVFLDRGAIAARLLVEPLLGGAADPDDVDRAGKVVVEHTNINPNKAAHIGHLRNAVLGDVLVRALRASGHVVEVQNYIDDTGVQLADVVVGFADLRGMSAAEVAAIPEPFDYHCWDLYAEVGRWYGDDEARQKLRRETLHQLELGSGPRAEMGELVARRIVRCHLATMRRLGIGYDLLTRESVILRRNFFATAFERLKESGAVRMEREGKNNGCWVMPLTESAEFAGLEDPDKVIVRSDGTVTYVGKDIAYQMWKFGLLGQDFGYRRWEEGGSEEGLWDTVVDGVPVHPEFGHAHRVVNVIDARQSYLQKIVRAGLESLGHAAEAERSIHFAYEMVALSPETARLLGFGDGEKALEMSGRKGIGVKADDLLDRLEEKSREEIAARRPELDAETLAASARQIATAAVRFFMVKATTTRVIAFDFAEALSFEGESGPYLQYALVRSANIERKLREAGIDTATDPGELASSGALWSDDLWQLVLDVAQIPEVVAKSASTLELSLMARHALGLAQTFNTVYHRHPILQEKDPELRRVRLAATRVFARGLGALLDTLGIPVPERM